MANSKLAALIRFEQKQNVETENGPRRRFVPLWAHTMGATNDGIIDGNFVSPIVVAHVAVAANKGIDSAYKRMQYAASQAPMEFVHVPETSDTPYRTMVTAYDGVKHILKTDANGNLIPVRYGIRKWFNTHVATDTELETFVRYMRSFRTIDELQAVIESRHYRINLVITDSVSASVTA